MVSSEKTPPPEQAEKPAQPAGPIAAADKPPAADSNAKELGRTGGSKGADPTRYGDWERGGRCIDF